MADDLFRAEAVKAQTGERWGRPIGLLPVAWSRITWLLLFFVVALVIFIATATFSRKETVRGRLRPSAAEARMRYLESEGERLRRRSRSTWRPADRHDVDVYARKPAIPCSAPMERLSKVGCGNVCASRAPADFQERRIVVEIDANRPALHEASDQPLGAYGAPSDDQGEKRLILIADLSHHSGNRRHQYGIRCGADFRARLFQLL